MGEELGGFGKSAGTLASPRLPHNATKNNLELKLCLAIVPSKAVGSQLLILCSGVRCSKNSGPLSLNVTQ